MRLIKHYGFVSFREIGLSYEKVINDFYGISYVPYLKKN